MAKNKHNKMNRKIKVEGDDVMNKHNENVQDTSAQTERHHTDKADDRLADEQYADAQQPQPADAGNDANEPEQTEGEKCDNACCNDAVENEQCATCEGSENADDPEKTGAENPAEDMCKQLEEMKDKLLRTAAEFDNFKKRTLKEKTELILNGGAKTVTAILPVLDDFERALADKSTDPEAIREGVQNIFNKFIKTLESLGVKRIETADADFNTDYHEAVAMVPGVADEQKGKVIDCLQTGYTMNDRVIRHARVAVGE